MAGDGDDWGFVAADGWEVGAVQQVDVEFGEDRVDTNFANWHECGTDRRHITHLGFAGAGLLAIAEWSTGDPI